MAEIVARRVKKQKTPAVLKHCDEVPEVLPDGYFKPKCKCYSKEITGSTKVTTNWWKHLVSTCNFIIISITHDFLYLYTSGSLMQLRMLKKEGLSESESQQTLTHLLQLPKKYNQNILSKDQ